MSGLVIAEAHTQARMDADPEMTEILTVVQAFYVALANGDLPALAATISSLIDTRRPGNDIIPWLRNRLHLTAHQSAWMADHLTQALVEHGRSRSGDYRLKFRTPAGRTAWLGVLDEEGQWRVAPLDFPLLRRLRWRLARGRRIEADYPGPPDDS
jgi:hypothetical protein